MGGAEGARGRGRVRSRYQDQESERRYISAVPAAADQVARVLVIIIASEAIHTRHVHGALAAVVYRDPKLAAVSGSKRVS